MKSVLFIFFLIFLFSCKPEVNTQKPFIKNNNDLLKFNIKIGKKQLELENNTIEKSLENCFSKNEFKKYVSGFWVNQSFNERAVNHFGDEIFYTYEVFDLNCKIIYTFKEIGVKKIYLEKQTEIRGIDIGLSNLKEKEKVILFLPSFFAYGTIGDENKIPQNFPIIVKLKIIKINKTKQ